MGLPCSTGTCQKDVATVFDCMESGGLFGIERGKSGG
jgi:hypothetical protein